MATTTSQQQGLSLHMRSKSERGKGEAMGFHKATSKYIYRLNRNWHDDVELYPRISSRFIEYLMQSSPREKTLKQYKIMLGQQIISVEP